MAEGNFLSGDLSVNVADLIQDEIDRTYRDLREVNLMLDQSQVEVEKLSQRNATITIHLQQVESQMEVLPVSEVKNAYEAALDAQQRLVGMRGQVEKLQSDQTNLDRYLASLRTIQKAVVEQGDGAGAVGEGGNFAKAEMLIQAQETERKRLSRQMHDGPAQALSNFILQTEIAMRLFEVDQERAREELTNLKGAASKTFQKVRDFIFDLRPMMLDDLGLVPTVKQYANSFREKHSVDVDFTATGNERRLESYLEVLVFRALQEFLNFAVVNGQAADIRVLLDMGQVIRLDVEDNGSGVDVSRLDREEDALGINVVKDRVEMLGGELVIDSALGQGTRISLIVPDIPPRGMVGA
ncbi:MAG: sensor histidine kinase [Anaerolineales bacterium]|nr:sensor histidine kinase [Anaerolineales bacterium]